MTRDFHFMNCRCHGSLPARLINEANNILGDRLILQNDSMIPSRSEVSAEYVKLYDLMKRSGLRFGFQPRDTNSETVKTTRELIQTTIAFGGTYLELPGAYLQSDLSRSEWEKFDHMLEDNR